MAAEPVLVAVDFTADELRLLFTDLEGSPVEQGSVRIVGQSASQTGSSPAGASA